MTVLNANLCYNEVIVSVKQKKLAYNCDYFLIRQFKHVFWCSKELSR